MNSDEVMDRKPASKKRAAVRRNIHKAGSIIVGSHAVICTVHNLSATGAALSVKRPSDLPDAFVLILEMEHRRRPCRVVWRRGNQIGVTFEHR